MDGNDHESAIASEQTVEIERSLGRHRRFGRNLARTVAASGVGLGVLYAAAAGDTEAFVEGALAFALIPGLPLGLVIWLVVKQERWEPASLPSSSLARIQLRPTFGDGVGFAASIPFGGR